MTPGEGGEDRRHVDVSEPVHDADRQLTGHGLACTSGIGTDRIDFVQHRPGALGDLLARDREPHRSAARHEVDAELGLGLSHLLGHRRLNDVQSSGGGAEGPDLGDGVKVLELAQVHHCR